MNFELNKNDLSPAERVKIEVREEKEPRLYQVIMHNDDFTPMEFVVSVLEKLFHMDRRQASEVMMTIHMKGMAACGIFTKDVAETKATQVIDFARMHEHPLYCSMESA